MNEWRLEERSRSSWCYFHPTQLLIGICPLCLNERLLVLANSKQPHLHLPHKFFTAKTPKRAPLPLRKIFALLNRHDTKQQKPDDYHSHITSSTTPEGYKIFFSFPFLQLPAFVTFLELLLSFVNQEKTPLYQSSLKKMVLPHGTRAKSPKCPTIEIRMSVSSLNESWDNKGKKIKTVVEHGKPRATLRWRRRIGQLLQLIRWKRSSKANMCHVGTKLEGGSRVKYGWVKSLTKRRAKE
ncbi:UNVERIFIED_CONTAM: hypothetical protein Slati_2555200 [Sesamum latifolium]|uniref:Uncharacterized protein n=1 Tax=Sesamum latifolium TaxID=2727402 RepID=A0AAW2VT46_9LAMI